MKGGGVGLEGRPPSPVGWMMLVLDQDAGDHKGPLHSTAPPSPLQLR